MRWVRAIVIAIVLGAGTGAIAALWKALDESEGVVLPTLAGNPIAVDARRWRPQVRARRVQLMAAE